MNQLILRNQERKTVLIIKELEPKFHGKITIHFAQGSPRTIETVKIENVYEKS